MPDVSDLAAFGQDFVARAVGAADSVVDSIVDQVTATANELLSLSQDIQNKVISALEWNA